MLCSVLLTLISNVYLCVLFLQVGHCAIGMFRTLNVIKCHHIYIYALVSAAVFFRFAGIVRTSVIVTGVQVFSRIFMVWFIASSIRQVTVPLLLPSSLLWLSLKCLYSSRALAHTASHVRCVSCKHVLTSCLVLMVFLIKIQNEESVILFLVVWTLTEITRYSYYTFKLLHHLPFFIKWARWSNWSGFCVLACGCWSELTSLCWSNSVESTVKITTALPPSDVMPFVTLPPVSLLL